MELISFLVGYMFDIFDFFRRKKAEHSQGEVFV
jgi:hypothetical protein